MSLQQLLLGVGASKKTYMDDVFSTSLYRGNTTARSITNGVDLSKGGLTWIKSRSASGNHSLFDTVRGVTKYIRTNTDDAENNDANTLSAFNNNGFTVGNDTSINDNNVDYSSWTFRKAPGFFDVVTWSGDNSNPRNISHSLGSVPGCIMVKRTDDSYQWVVYHRGVDGANPENYILQLNSSSSRADEDWFGDTAPTSTHFTVSGGATNASDATYVAYVFAGGESTAATATSVEFDGSNDDLTIPSSTDFDFGSGDFTIECWIKPDVSNAKGIINRSNNGATSDSSWIIYQNGSDAQFYWVDSGSPNTWSGPVSAESTLKIGQWSHVAVAREGSKLRIFVNGILEDTTTASFTIPTSSRNVDIGCQDGGLFFNGHISNVRIVKGTAVYTSPFRPPTEPLSNITNTKLLCCQGSSATSATVIPSGSITNDGSTHTTDSPFDDPAAFTFGENEDQNIIKCGSYVGNGSSTGPEIDLGWEPQWILVKNTDLSTEQWFIFDCMRGIITGSNDEVIEASRNVAENDYTLMSLTSTGFKLDTSDDKVNGDGHSYIYTAIRRTDGYVGKPADAGTDVFAMDTGASSSTIPNFDSGFPVDFMIMRRPASEENWYSGSRLTQGKYGVIDTTEAESSQSDWVFDSNTGWNNGGWANTYQSWMWKRHAGSFDVVTYTGNSTDRYIPHNLGKTPEMVWFMTRSQDLNNLVWQKDISPAQQLELNTNSAQGSGAWQFSSDLPFSSTHIGLKAGLGSINNSSSTYLALLFASVDGISKCDSYTGPDNGSAGANTITKNIGFQPRFLLIKCTSHATNWIVLDSVRGFGSGNDKPLFLDQNWAQESHQDWGAFTSTGFELNGGFSAANDPNRTYIYYAHA